ncbi:MAG: glutamate--tRNA ligase [Oscillospiraceae bacterium]|nr:glutamate--tRNA ligase [Oscillospiraceae bacterium]
MVTRFSPSPTGFLHIGNVFGALTDERLAHQSGGVFILRIEDTDSKREVPGGVGLIIDNLKEFGISFDECATEGGDVGAYGPYRQSRRAAIYQAFAKEYVRRGLAYPCFCSEETLASMRDAQKAAKANPGYHGGYAACRGLTPAEAEAKVREGLPFVIRFRSCGDPSRTAEVRDLIKGTLRMPENDQDFVMLKSDGTPTYHFGHVIDDTLMGTTHVVRGDEWLATLPYHIQMFDAFGLRRPEYAHTATVDKRDGASKRKISKRKDPEAKLTYYLEAGFPIPSITEYVMTLLNSDYEEWRRANPGSPHTDFPFALSKMGVSGPLFDLGKLRDVSKDVIAGMGAGELTDLTLAWAARYDPKFHALASGDPAYLSRILSIGRGGPKPRKDLAAYSEVGPYAVYFYDEAYVPAPDPDYPACLDSGTLKALLTGFLEGYESSDDQAAWFGKVKEAGARLGFAPDTGSYKATPESYLGSVSDVSMALRLAVTGRKNSPDLWEVMRVMGAGRVARRISMAMEIRSAKL